MIAAARWTVLLASVHRWSGSAILLAVAGAVIAEKARKRLRGGVA